VRSSVESPPQFREGDAKYYEFAAADIPGFRQGLGHTVPFVDVDTPVQSVYEEWNVRVGVLHAGVIELVTSNGVAIVSTIEIEFFPPHIPVYTNMVEVPFVVDEHLYSAGTQFPPVLSPGVDGLQQATLFGAAGGDSPGQRRSGDIMGTYMMAAGSVHPATGPWQIGSGWVDNGSRWVHPLARMQVSGRVDANGVFRIPLKEGLRVLSVEVAVCSYYGSGDNSGGGGGNSIHHSHRTMQTPGIIWCKLSSNDGSNNRASSSSATMTSSATNNGKVTFVFKRSNVHGNTVLSGGPQSPHHVVLPGEELLLGSDLAPAWVLGYRVIYCQNDSAVQTTVSATMLIAKEAVEQKANQLLVARAKQSLLVDLRTILLPLPSNHDSVLGVGTFGPVRLVTTLAGDTFALKPVSSSTIVNGSTGNSSDRAAEDEEEDADGVFDCLARLSTYTNHRNIAAIRGMCLLSEGGCLGTTVPSFTIPCMLHVLQQKFTLNDAIDSHACSLEALACM
jgi:hypothetical protein